MNRTKRHTYGSMVRETFGVELGARDRYAVSLIVGMQARAILHREPDNLGAMLGYIVAEAAASQAQKENAS